MPSLADLARRAALEIAPIHTGWTVIDEFAGRFVYFYTGYISRRTSSRFAAGGAGQADAARWPCSALWALVNGALVFAGYAELPFVSLALGLIGAGRGRSRRGAAVEEPLCSSRCAIAARTRSSSISPSSCRWRRPARCCSRPASSPTRHDLADRHRRGVVGALCWYWAVRGTPLSFLFVRPACVRLTRKPRSRCAAAGGMIHSARSGALIKQRLTAHIRAMPAACKIHVRKSRAGTRGAIRQPHRPSAEERRPCLPGRRLGLHLPRLSRAAAADPQVGRVADQRRARLLQHAVEAAQRHEAGREADPSRRRVRQVGEDLPHRDLSRVQGAPAGRRRTISFRNSR